MRTDFSPMAFFTLGFLLGCLVAVMAHVLTYPLP